MGYGDAVPQTVLGKLFASLSMLLLGNCFWTGFSNDAQCPYSFFFFGGGGGGGGGGLGSLLNLFKQKQMHPFLISMLLSNFVF